MPHKDLLQKLLPLTSYDPNATRMDISLTAEGGELDRVLEDSVKSLGGLTPFTHKDWMPDWERVYGLPNICSKGDQLRQDRIALLALAFLERGGISAVWLKHYAALSGYTITISEYKPFKAGLSKAGEKLTNGPWAYAFRVGVVSGTTKHFKAGRSVAGEALQTWGDDIIECIINKYKPAHTVGLVAYL